MSHNKSSFFSKSSIIWLSQSPQLSLQIKSTFSLNKKAIRILYQYLEKNKQSYKCLIRNQKKTLSVRYMKELFSQMQLVSLSHTLHVKKKKLVLQKKTRSVNRLQTLSLQQYENNRLNPPIRTLRTARIALKTSVNYKRYRWWMNEHWEATNGKYRAYSMIRSRKGRISRQWYTKDLGVSWYRILL